MLVRAADHDQFVVDGQLGEAASPPPTRASGPPTRRRSRSSSPSGAPTGAATALARAGARPAGARSAGRAGPAAARPAERTPQRAAARRGGPASGRRPGTSPRQPATGTCRSATTGATPPGTGGPGRRRAQGPAQSETSWFLIHPWSGDAAATQRVSRFAVSCTHPVTKRAPECGRSTSPRLVRPFLAHEPQESVVFHDRRGRPGRRPPVRPDSSVRSRGRFTSGRGAATGCAGADRRRNRPGCGVPPVRRRSRASPSGPRRPARSRRRWARGTPPGRRRSG